MNKGLFIVFDGMDGSGKSTQFLRAGEFLYNFSKTIDHIVLTREPTYGKIGRQIREMLAKDADPYKNKEKLVELFVEDRKDHLQNYILPLLQKNALVLCDRFKYSTIAYQSTQGFSAQKIIDLHKGLSVPDLVLIFDLPAEMAVQRMLSRGMKIEKFEKLEFLEKLRRQFLLLPTLLSQENIKIIDASKSIPEIVEQVKKEILPLLQTCI